MSYIDLPRLHFSGSFQADPPTANIYTRNYDDATFDPDYEQAEIGGFLPRGTGAFRLLNCQISSVSWLDGSLTKDPKVDGIIGTLVDESPDRVAAKIVDLDPMQRRASQIWGLEIVAGGGPDSGGFRGRFLTAPFADMWMRHDVPSEDGLSVFYQSVLTDVSWSPQPSSKFVRQLQERTLGDRLSIKFVLDGYDLDPKSPTFSLGRLVGSIGPVLEEEPDHFVAERLLRPTKGSSFGYAPVKVESTRVHLDFGNSLPTATPGGAAADLGELQVVAWPKTGAPVLLGAVPYLEKFWLEGHAGILTVEPKPAVMKLIADSPLGLAETSGGTVKKVYLKEREDGALLRADTIVLRLDAGTQGTTNFYARTFGQPAAGVTITPHLDSTFIDNMAQGMPAGQPASALKVPGSLVTDAKGRAEMTLEAGDPGNPREFIDGQVYAVSYAWKGVPDAVYHAESPSGHVNALVWDAYPQPECPTWLDHVQPIFRQYANLYPAMKPILDLADYESVRAKTKLLRSVFALPETDPNYMPVTRDLSGPKRRMIQNWLQAPRYLHISTVEDLREILQIVLSFEQFLIPPYLFALFSIQLEGNQDIAKILQPVGMKHMVNLSLCANLLNAIGGRPSLADPSLVQSYPSKSPAGLYSDLDVHLRACSIEQIRDVFMVLEEPEWAATDKPFRPRTVGGLYALIEEGFERLAAQEDIFTGDPKLQVRKFPSDDQPVPVTDLASARQAVRYILTERQGISPDNPQTGRGNLAAYFRLEQIVRGRYLVQDKDGFSFTGDEIRFDPSGIWPVAEDPRAEQMAEGSRALLHLGIFNQTYTRLLGALERVFNGQPEGINSAVGLMFSLDIAGRELMRMAISHSPTRTAGPSFELVEPG